MKKEQLIVYVTDDGKKFDKEKDALRHEKELNATSLLEKYRIDGPSDIPFEHPTRIDPEYKWYKAENKEDLDKIESLLKNFGLIVVYSNISYPEYLGVSFKFSRVVLMGNLQARHELEMKQWDNFIASFEDMERER